MPGMMSGMATAQDQEDAAWLEAWRAGDRAAGQRLFARYYDPVARFFFNKVGDTSSDLIRYRDFVVKVLEATNQTLSYVVVSDGS